MHDYYMSFSVAQWGTWNEKLRELAIGQCFTVDDGDSRGSIMSAARRIGICVRSRKLDGAGYEIQRVNCNKPRKRGHPTMDQYE